MATRLMAGLLLAPALLLAACSASVGSQPSVDKAQVEERITTELTATVGQAPDSVTCPGDLTATVGTTMRCALVAGTDTYGVTVTVTSVDGTDVKFDLQVDDTASPAS